MSEIRALSVRMNSERLRGEESAFPKSGAFGGRGWMAKRCFIERTGQVDGEFGAEAMTMVTPPRNGSVFEAGIVNGSIKLRAIRYRELATSQKSSPGQILRSVEDCVVNVGQVTSDEPETEENVEGDGEFWLTVTVALEALDAPNDPLQSWGVAGFERKACIDMEGTNGGEVALNGFVENGAVLASKLSGPGHETEFSCREELTGSGGILGVEPNEVEKGFLSG
ncbi:hypothetical protein B0H12DRAFT_1082378 [Mycena haematopus]|nr:hypothetical protein B0H12DRAFT_1082378 [Mycena haematopus]